MRRTAAAPPEITNLQYISVLGSGGFSDVFLYQQQLPRRKVAVKVLVSDGLDPTARENFINEANLMARLSAHPNIVTIFGAAITDDDRPYFLMEYCSGPSLAEKYKRRPFGVADALRVGVQLAGAVATAHAAGILHRDIKPANVLTNDYGSPALTDFGISSAVDDELMAHTTTTLAELRAQSGATSGESVGMSVPWSPPEMFEDMPRPDIRADIYSLSATIFTLLAGRTPFEIPGRPNRTLDLIGRIERGAISPIGRQDVPPTMTAVLEKGMARRRGDRYASALDFARALQRVELELGYAPTRIEVPTLDDLVEQSVGTDAEETSLRRVATVVAQPHMGSPTRAGARSEQHGAPDEKTRMRESGAVDDTQVRPSPPVEVVTTTADTVPDVRSEPIVRHRSRLIVAGILIVVILAVVACGVAFGPHLIGASSSVHHTSSPQDPDPQAAVPVPTDLQAALNGSSVTFTWNDHSPAKGDTFQWSYSVAGSPHSVSTTSVTLAVSSQPSKQCIIVRTVRPDSDSGFTDQSAWTTPVCVP